MRYLLLLYGNENDGANMDEAQMGEMMQAYGTFTAEVQQNGMMQSGEALQPTSTATTVRVRDGKTQTTDGPFAETREQLGGFYLLDCKDIDEAVATAAKIPAAKDGAVEVRPIMELTGMPTG